MPLLLGTAVHGPGTDPLLLQTPRPIQRVTPSFLGFFATSSQPSQLPSNGRTLGMSGSPPGAVRILNWNSNGLAAQPRRLELLQFLVKHSVDIACITKTHLNPRHKP